MWTCPTCNRHFNHVTQEHSCVQLPVDIHFANKDKAIEALCRKLIAAVEALGEVHISATKSAIMVSANGNFCSIKPKKTFIEVEFLLDEAVEEFPVYKIFRLSKKRVAHFVRIEEPRQVDAQLVRWLRRAYELRLM